MSSARDAQGWEGGAGPCPAPAGREVAAQECSEQGLQCQGVGAALLPIINLGCEQSFSK